MLHIGEIKLMIQNSGIRFDDQILNEIKEEYLSPNSKMNSIMFKISLDGGEQVPIYAPIYKNKAEAYLVTKKNGKYYISVFDEANINVYFMDKKVAYGIPYSSAHIDNSLFPLFTYNDIMESENHKIFSVNRIGRHRFP